MAEPYIRKLQENLKEILQESFTDARQRKIRLIIPLLDIIKGIEAKSLRVDDMRSLQGAIADYLQQNELQAEKKLIRIVSKRLSMAYLPGISSLGLCEYIQYLEQAGFGNTLQQHALSWTEFNDRVQLLPEAILLKKYRPGLPLSFLVQLKIHLLLLMFQIQFPLSLFVTFCAVFDETSRHCGLLIGYTLIKFKKYQKLAKFSGYFNSIVL